MQLTLTRGLNEPNLEKRANIVLSNAEKLKCKVFLKPKDIVSVCWLYHCFLGAYIYLHSGK